MPNAPQPELTPRRATLADIAAVVGCHKSTVSLALRSSPLISHKKTAAILAAAERLNYRPDPALARLAALRWGNRPSTYGARSETLAFVEFPRHRPGVMKRLLASARPMAEAHGFHLDCFRIADYPRPQRLLEVMRHRGIEGVIIAPLPPETHSSVEALDWSSFTVVQCNLGWRRLPMLAATFDWFRAVQLAWRKAVERGYRRIGPAIFAHDPWAPEDDDRLGAVGACQHHAPQLPAIPPLLCPHEDRASFLGWFRQHRPDVVISFHGNALGWLREAGIAVPGQCGFVTLNGTETSTESCTKGCSDRIGAAAVELLLAAMRNHEQGLPPAPRSLVVEPVWHEGDTLPPATAPSAARGRRKSRRA